jgi:hypothetical protein
VGRDRSVGIVTGNGLDGLAIESRWGRNFSAPVHSRPGGPPSLLYNGYRVFTGVKAAGAWCWPSTPSNAQVKERVQLYLYSSSGPSWLVLGWSLPLPLPIALEIGQKSVFMLTVWLQLTCLTFQCQPRCNVRSYNSSNTATLGAACFSECVTGYHKHINPSVLQMDGIWTPALAVCYIRLLSGRSLFFHPTGLRNVFVYVCNKPRCTF